MKAKTFTIALVLAATVGTAAAQHASPAPVAGGGFRATGRFVPDSAPGPNRPQGPGGPNSAARPPRSSVMIFRGQRWLWPLMFYGGIGVDYVDYQDDGAGAETFAPADAPLGGLQLDVEPRRGEVYVDGLRAGVVADFSGYYHHLDATAGLHRIAILAEGYDPLIFEIVVPPGRTTTYRGALMRTPGR